MGKELIKAKAKEDEHVIQPQTTTPATDTSDWPLLLKNYDRRTEYLLPCHNLPNAKERTNGTRVLTFPKCS